MKLPSITLSIFRNKKQLFFLIALIALVTISIIMVSVLTRYVSEAELRAWEVALTNFTIAEPGVNSVDNKTINELESSELVLDVLEFSDAIISMPGILNSEYRPVIALNKNSIKTFLKSNNMELTKGSYPEKDTRGLLLSADIAQAKKLSVGSYVGRAIDDNEFLWGRFKVTGIIEGELSLGIASFSYFKRKMAVNSSLILLPRNNILEMNRMVKNNYQNINFETVNTLRENHRNKNENLIKLVWIIIGILTVSLSLIIGLYISLYLKSRLKEFALFYSKGIKRKEILLYILKELILVTLLSVGIGILSAEGILFILKYLVYEQGVFLAQISLRELLLIIPVIVSIIIVSVYISVKNINNKKMEEIIMGV